MPLVGHLGGGSGAHGSLHLVTADACLIPKAWKGQVEKKGMGWMEHNAQWDGEGARKPMRKGWDQESRDREVRAAEWESGPHFPPLMAKAKTRLKGQKCFTCGQVGPFQRECPNLEGMWAKALRGPQVMTEGSDYFTRSVITVWLNGGQVDTLVDMRCGQTLVQQAEESPLAEFTNQVYPWRHKGNTLLC